MALSESDKRLSEKFDEVGPSGFAKMAKALKGMEVVDLNSLASLAFFAGFAVGYRNAKGESK